ncbi:MAG: hypothetical protein WEB59_16425 [Thermoanaerobaculia bacterium]
MRRALFFALLAVFSAASAVAGEATKGRLSRDFGASHPEPGSTRP